MQQQHVGVVGAGTIGVGVAQSLAQAGHLVSLVDVTESQLHRAEENIRRNIRMFRLLGGDTDLANRRTQPAEILPRITFTTEYSALATADYVIENVTEKWPIKKAVHEALDRICPSACVFAANTSCIPITRIAAVTNRPDRVLGVHFMNPVPQKPVAEVIRGYHTSEETLRRTDELLASMGKEGIVVNDMPGFVSNRILMMTINEAAYVLQDHVASAKDVDHIFKRCFGHKMGPLETADLIGLDTILFSIDALYESFNDSKYRPCPLLKKMVDAGLLGCKTGEGFHAYD
jgi:3-hydroxybutyryl-CoA dehydrogenase